MTCSDPCVSYLRDQGFRLTPQRLAILRILRSAGSHLSPVEVFQRATPSLPGLTEATVYRTLAFLVERGLALPARMPDGQLGYEAAEHIHHHLVCRSCGSTEEIDHGALQSLYQELQVSTGYIIDSVHLTFYGLCPACQSE